AAAIGNHEFDWTVDTLRARMADAHYHFLAANITDTAGTTRPAWAEPFSVIQRGGVRVAAIGLALPATPQTTSPRNVRGLAFGDGARAVRGAHGVRCGRASRRRLRTACARTPPWWTHCA